MPVICPYAGYATNTRFVNHCLVAFFQRIADPSGINMEPMLYQVTSLPTGQHATYNNAGLQLGILGITGVHITPVPADPV